MPKLQKGVNDLLTWCKNNGDFGEKLISEWVGLDEEGNSIKIDEIARGSNKKVKWRCLEDHEWVVSINDRVRYKTNCPNCKAIETGKIKSKPVQGVNDLLTWCKNNGEQGERLMQEWVGLDEEGNSIKIDEIARASSKKSKMEV